MNPNQRRINPITILVSMAVIGVAASIIWIFLVNRDVTSENEADRMNSEAIRQWIESDEQKAKLEIQATNSVANP